jgi:DNA-directed RNA polymerase I, II, and III subunit RPABC2
MSDDEAIPDIDEDIIPDDIKDDKEEELSDLDDTDLKKTSVENLLSDNEDEYSTEEELKVDNSSDDDDIEYAVTSVDSKNKDIESSDCYQKHAKDDKYTPIENKKLIVDSNKWNGYLIVKKKDRITGNKMFSYEYARVLGTRATQLESGAPPLIEAPKNIDSIELAKLELMNKKCPITIVRPLPNMSVELWDCDELYITCDNVNDKLV